MCVYIYVCVCVCVCVYIYVYICQHLYIVYICQHIYMSTSKVFSNFSNQLLPTALTHLICFKMHLFFLYFCSFLKKKTPTSSSRQP